MDNRWQRRDFLRAGAAMGGGLAMGGLDLGGFARQLTLGKPKKIKSKL